MVTSGMICPRKALPNWDLGVRRLLSGRKLLGRGGGKEDTEYKEVPEAQVGRRSECKECGQRERVLRASGARSRWVRAASHFMYYQKLTPAVHSRLELKLGAARQ